MGYNDALEIKANREIIKSIFEPIKQAYSTTLSNSILSKYENFFLRYKLLRISFDAYGIVRAFGKDGPNLSEEEIELLPRCQELFSALEMLISKQKPPILKTKLMRGWYVQIGKTYFLISDKILDPAGEEYSYYVQPVKKRLGKTAAVLKPSNILASVKIKKGGNKKS